MGGSLTALVIAVGVSTVVAAIAWLRSTPTALDFQLAGQRVGVATNALAICGDYVSAASFLGVAAAVYAAGLDGIWYATGFAAGFVPVLLFVAAPLRRFGQRSLPDFLGRRFRSERIRLVAVVVVQLILLAYLIPQAVAAGLAWELLIDRSLPGLSSYATGAMVTIVIIAGLVTLGGMRGTTWNQALQFVALVAVLVWLALALAADGFSYRGTVAEVSAEPLLTVVEGPDGTAAATEVTSELDDGPARFGLPGGRYGVIAQLSILVTLVLGTTGLPHVMNRFFTSPTGRAARMTTVWVLGLLGGFYALAVMMGTAARSVVEEHVEGAPWLQDLTSDGLLDVPEHAMVVLGRVFGGETGASVVGAAALLAIMSTIGGLLLAGSTSWGHDVYERHVNPTATRTQALRAGQVAVLAGAVTAAVIAVVLDPQGLAGSVPSIIATLVTGAFGLAACTLTPALLCGIWWKRTTPAAVLVALVVGTLAWGVSFGLGLAVDGAPPLLTAPALIVTPVVFAVIVVVSWLTPPMEQLDEIWIRLHGTASDRHAEQLTEMTMAATRR